MEIEEYFKKYFEEEWKKFLQEYQEEIDELMYNEGILIVKAAFHRGVKVGLKDHI